MKQILIKIIILISVFLLGVSSQALSENLFKKDTIPPLQNTEQTQLTASIMIDFGNGTIRTMNDIPVHAQDTLYTTLVAMSERDEFTLQTTDYGDMGVFVEGIDGIKGVNGTWWQVWINNTYATEGASSITTRHGDIILWKLTTEQTLLNEL